MRAREAQGKKGTHQRITDSKGWKVNVHVLRLKKISALATGIQSHTFVQLAVLDGSSFIKNEKIPAKQKYVHSSLVVVRHLGELRILARSIKIDF